MSKKLTKQDNSKMPITKKLKKAITKWIDRNSHDLKSAAILIGGGAAFGLALAGNIIYDELSSSKKSATHAAAEFKAICTHHNCTEQEAAQHVQEALDSCMLRTEKGNPMTKDEALQTTITQQ